MRLIRSLIFPWFIYFLLGITAIVVVGVKFPNIALPQSPLFPQASQTHEFSHHPLFLLAMLSGLILCLMANFRTLGGVGIWMSESLPESLRYGSFRWIFRAIKAAAVAAVFWFVGQLPWIPLVWQAAVIPAVFTICLFVAVWSLMGPVLKFSSNLAWNRSFSVIFNFPILLLIPVTAIFIGRTALSAYRASQPDVILISPTAARELQKTNAEESVTEKTAAADGKSHNAIVDAPAIPDKDLRAALRSPNSQTRAKAFQQISTLPDCGDYNREIQVALDPKGAKDVVFWASKAIHCSQVRSIVALPKLVTIMQEHADADTRAAAISAMPKYGRESVRSISYLLVKRLGDTEPPPVVEAAARAMAPIGPEQQKWTTTRLKALLNDPQSSFVAARSLIRDYAHDDFVAEYVAQNLGGDKETTLRATDMICLLPESKRSVAHPFVSKIVAEIKTADLNDPALKALNCMGDVGFAAIKAEVTAPKAMDRALAAKILSLLDIKKIPGAIETADQCVRDGNDQVRQWCSKSLGKIGAPALPKILDLLNSSDGQLKAAGRDALQYMDDPTAKDELQKIRADNSGWMANNRKLEIAKAISLALAKIQNDPQPADSSAQ